MFSAHTSILPSAVRFQTMEFADSAKTVDLALDPRSTPSRSMGPTDNDYPIHDMQLRSAQTMGPGLGDHMMNELQLRQIQAERQIVQAQEVSNVRNDMHLVKREVSDLKSMVLQIGLSKTYGAGPSEPTPVNVVVNTQNNVTQEVQQPVRDERDGWCEFNKSLRIFFKSPFNRFCFFGTIGFGLYVYNQKLTHTWRMTEMQRRIDTNMFLRLAQWMNGRTYA